LTTLNSVNRYSPQSVYNSNNKALTAEELDLVREYEEYLKHNDYIFKKLRGEIDAEDLDELIRPEKDPLNPRPFDNISRIIGMQIYNRNDLMNDITQKPVYNLPHQGFSINTKTNSITLGIGSKIPLGGHYLYIYDNIVSTFPSNYKSNKEDTGLKILMGVKNSNETKALEELIYGVESGNANWGTNSKMNSAILSLLMKMGVDTSRDFSINGVAFEVKDGIVQTKNYVAPQNEPLGFCYLNNLITRAYEQNLI
jgi:hypothetical protein